MSSNSELQLEADTFVPHAYAEHPVDLGEITMNYAVTGPSEAPVLLLIPGQTESWWGYEKVMQRLEDRFRVYAVDLRGQGRTSRTPGRYTFDNLGSDLVRFIHITIGRPTIVCGFSSGGVLAAWLSAYAAPGLIRATMLEDPALSGAPLEQFLVARMFSAFSEYLGDQWSIGDWPGFVKAVKTTMPPMLAARPYDETSPPQMLKEYDPEWARAAIEGAKYDNFDRVRMLRAIKTPVLMTHHARGIEPQTGLSIGAMTDEDANQVRECITSTGNRFDYHSFPEMGHFMHVQDPDLYARIVTDWVATLE